MDKSTIEAIEKALAAGDRVEIIPNKEGYRVMRIHRKQIIKVEKPTGQS